MAAPRVHRLSFSATGTPASGPGSRPAATAASTASACARASSPEDGEERVELAVAGRHRGQRLVRPPRGPTAGPTGPLRPGPGRCVTAPHRRCAGTRKRWSSTAGATGQHLVAVEARAGLVGPQHVLEGDRVRRGLQVRQVERRHVGRVVEHGAQLRGEELDLLVTQVQAGQARHVDDVLAAERGPAGRPRRSGSRRAAAARRSTNSTVRASISSLSQSSVATWKLRSSITCSTGPLARATRSSLDAGSTTWSCTLVKSEHGAGHRLELRPHLGRGGEQRERRPQREPGVGRPRPRPPWRCRTRCPVPPRRRRRSSTG